MTNIDPNRERNPELIDIVQALITEHTDLARVLELYYWSQEPGLLDVIRALMALPPKTRAALQSFLSMAPNPQLISVVIDEFGQLTLSSPQVAEAMTVMREATAEKKTRK